MMVMIDPMLIRCRDEDLGEEKKKNLYQSRFFSFAGSCLK